ncbi:MAG: LysR family transcriptional regulator [Lachnospiraceae bacterium]|nr:LysR family transcriptional regulator [Lachnospiraceae bacterium]
MNLSNLNYYNMTYFIIVLEEKNLSKAAERIGISRQALSKAISSLEQTIGKQLFFRKQSGVEPTLAALELKTHVKTILKEYHQISNQGKLEQLADKRICVYTIDSVSQVFPNSFYDNFYEKYPDFILTIEESNEGFAIKQLLSSRCDFAIVSHETDYYNYNYTHLFHADYGSYMSCNHPLAQMDNLTLSDFKNTKFIGKSMDLEYYNRAVQAVYSNNLELDFFLEITNPSKRRDMVRCGKYVSCAWNYNMFNDMNDGVIFKPVKEMGDGIDLFLIENKHLKKQPHKAQIFKEYLLEWIYTRTTKDTK